MSRGMPFRLFRWGIRCVLVLLFVPLPVLGQEPERQGQGSGRSCCVWTVKAAQSTLYLLGSTHLLKQEHFPLPPEIYHALERSDRVVFEVHPGTLAPEHTASITLHMGLYPEGHTLKSQMSPEAYAKVHSALQKRGYPVDRFQAFKPWLLALTIASAELQKLGFDPAIGVDRHVFEQAQLAGKEIEGLETFEQQMGFFDGMSSTTQERFLLQSLEELAVLHTEVNQIVQAWVQGNALGLAVMGESMKKFPEVYASLMTRRNARWLGQIDSFLQEKETYLVVVGVLHLLGDDGLVAMLRDKGFRVVPM